MKISLAVAGVVLLGTTMAACGGSDGGSKGSSSNDSASGSYCSDLKSASTQIKGFSSGDLSGLNDAFAAFHKLAKEAPGSIKSDWATLDGAVTKIESAFAGAGIKASDLPEIQKGTIPKGVDVSKLAGLTTTLSEVSSAKFTKAQTDISDHAKKVCKVDLGGLK